jgi:DNA-binding NarL/FixJ family response regulator
MSGKTDIYTPLSREGPEPRREGPPARIALVDDEESVHQLMRRIFEKHVPDWTLHSYLDGRAALRQIPESPPDAVLMDIAMPGGTGIECAKNLRTLLPDLPIVMLSAHIDPEILLGSLMAGAGGCLHKPASSADIMTALQKTMAGSFSLCPRAEKTMLECFHVLAKNVSHWGLTGREREIMTGICRQKSDKQLAEALGISTSTVHAHTAMIFKKLGVNSRTEAIRKLMSAAPAA